jgi:hypothetical protein
MKRLLIAAAALALMATASQARMRHDRVCDIAQDKADNEKLNPPGGNYFRFGTCNGIEEEADAAPGWGLDGGTLSTAGIRRIEKEKYSAPILTLMKTRKTAGVEDGRPPRKPAPRGDVLLRNINRL